MSSDCGKSEIFIIAINLNCLDGMRKVNKEDRKQKEKERRKEIENARKRRHKSDSDSEDEYEERPRKLVGKKAFGLTFSNL